VTSIGDYAFEGCSGLTSVTFEAGSQLESIGGGAFEGCSGLTSVYYQGDLARWCEGFEGGYSLMKYCENLYINGELVQGDLVIPAGVTSIGYEAFSGCSGLTSVEIPASVTSIGVGAFSRCSGLSSVEIPAGVTSIGIEAFYECSGLSSVEIPAGVTSIGYGAFRECSGLTSVTFGDTSGWYVTTSETDAANKTGGTAVFPSPTDLAANAELVNGIYDTYYWYKID